MGHDSALANPSQIWGGNNSAFNQVGDFLMAPFKKQQVNLQAPPPPPNPSLVAGASLQNDLDMEKQQYTASSILTGGTGTGVPNPMAASTILRGR